MMRPVLTANTDEDRMRILADPAFRARFRAAVDRTTPDTDQDISPKPAAAAMMRKGFLMTEISWYPPNREYESRPAVEVACELKKHAADLVLDMALETGLAARFRTPQSNFDEDDLQEVLQDPNVVLGLGDGGAHVSQLCDATYATYLLQRWVRERKAFSLETAIHKLSARNADVFGIKDRGRLLAGRPADIVVFDPDSVGPAPLERVYDLPSGADRLISKPIGIHHVIVNGVELPPPGEPIRGTLPGRLLRNGAARKNH